MADRHALYEKPEDAHFENSDPLDKYPGESIPEDIETAAKPDHIVPIIAGKALVERDVAAETRLRWKLDLCVMPIV